MRYRSFEAGTVISREGEPGESLYVVVDGLVHLLRSLVHEPEIRTRSIFDEGRLVGKLRSGEVFGTGALITGEPAPATAAAVDTDPRARARRFPRSHRAFPGAREPHRDPHAAARRGDLAPARGGRRGRRWPSSAAGPRTRRPPRSGARWPCSTATSLGDALDQLDARLRDNRTVILVRPRRRRPAAAAAPRRPDGRRGREKDADRLAAVAERHGGVEGQPIEVVLGDGVEPPPVTRWRSCTAA